MDRLAIIATEADRLADVLGKTPDDAQVPTCREWNAGDLLWHLTEVHLTWAGILRSEALTDDQAEAVEAALPSRPETLEQLLSLRREATAALIQALNEYDDDQPRWTWFPPEQTVGFTRRMQTYEATMHRVDAELTAGLRPQTLTENVATGAVDHCVDIMWWGGMPDWAHYTPSAVFSGEAHQLALWAWGRSGTVEATGDTDAIAAMRNVIAEGIQ